MTDQSGSWQPDPHGRHQYRYWNGTEWTDQVANNGVISSDPPTPNPVSPAPSGDSEPVSAPPASPVDPTVAMPAAGGVAPPGAVPPAPPMPSAPGPAQPPSKSGNKTPLIVVGIVAVVALIAGGIFFFLKDDDDKADEVAVEETTTPLDDTSDDDSDTDGDVIDDDFNFDFDFDGLEGLEGLEGLFGGEGITAAQAQCLEAEFERLDQKYDFDSMDEDGSDFDFAIFGEMMEVFSTCDIDLADLMGGAFTGDFGGGLQSGHGYGDNPELDALWDACEAGDMEACDDLYFASDFDTEYEKFADTCGGRTSGGTYCS